MNDKTKVSLLYMLTGGVAGVVSAFLSVYGVPYLAVIPVYGGTVYGTTYLYSLIGVKFERLGETHPKSALNGLWSSLMPWLVAWTMAFYLLSPVVVLADASQRGVAEELGEYLEGYGISVKVTDDYPRYLSSHKVIILGERVPIPLGTSYGVSAFPDAVQWILKLERGKETVRTEKMSSGEVIIIEKLGRTVVVISGPDLARAAQESRDIIADLMG